MSRNQVAFMCVSVHNLFPASPSSADPSTNSRIDPSPTRNHSTPLPLPLVRSPVVCLEHHLSCTRAQMTTDNEIDRNEYSSARHAESQVRPPSCVAGSACLSILPASQGGYTCVPARFVCHASFHQKNYRDIVFVHCRCANSICVGSALTNFSPTPEQI